MGYDTDKKIRIKDLKSLALKAAGEWASASERLTGLEDTDSEFITKLLTLRLCSPA